MSEGHVKMKAETGVIGLQVFQEREEAREEAKKGLPMEPLEEGYRPANTLFGAPSLLNLF